MRAKMPETILAIDVGLTNCKTVLFSRKGEMVARAAVPYPTYYPRPGWAEQDPEDWWQAALAGMRSLRETAPTELGQVCAISVTGHMHALACLGAGDSTLGRALVLGDQRGIGEAEAISANVGLEHIYRLTGARMDASMPLAKLCWLQTHAPNMVREARSFLACKDWIRHRLTGDLFTDPIDACGTSFYDIGRRAWSEELAALAGLRPEQFPRVADPCAVAGTLRGDAARALGMKQGIPVVVGAGDDVEVLGNGLLGPGMALEHLGTTGSILACADHPVHDPAMAVELYPHVDPGLWVLGGSVTAAGAALAWAQQVLREDRAGEASDALRPNLERPLVFIPHLTGERCPAWDPHARGSWLGLGASHTAGDLRRAVQEGIAFSLKSVLDRIESLVGPQAQISVSGREISSDRWLAQRASIYGRPLACLRTPEPTALGAMIVAAVGVGLYKDLAQAVAGVTGWDDAAAPDPALVDGYRRLYGLYSAAAEAIGPVMRRWEEEK